MTDKTPYLLITRTLDKISHTIGSVIAWALLLMMLTTCAVVVMRYLFHGGNIIFFQELIRYLHATTFMLAAGWTLQRNGHVRVDILYRSMNARKQAWINACGALFFLLPVSGLLIVVSYDFVVSSWVIREGSADAGGIPFVYGLKTLIPAMCLLLIVQGIAEVLRSAAVLAHQSEPASD